MHGFLMTQLPDAQLTHVGLYVKDIDAMKAFYMGLLDMVVSDEGTHTGRELVFLTRSADEHHQLVLARGAVVPKGASTLNQLSFRLGSLEVLRALYARFAKHEVRGLDGRDHGNSWSFYALDPESNKLELYVPTPWHVPQPWRAPLDLTMDAAAIISQTEARVKDIPGSGPASEWAERTRAKLQLK